MKKLVLMFCSMFLIAGVASANNNVGEEATLNAYDGKSYIFIEGSVEFSVFPDGQFDFVYVGGNRGENISVKVQL